MGRIARPGFAVLIKIGALTGLGSVLLANAYDVSRTGMSIACDGLLPTLFTRVHPMLGTPWLASITSVFIVVCITVMWLRSARPDLRGGFRVPLCVVWIGVGPVLGEMSNQVRRGDVLPVCPLAGAALYLGYGPRRARRQVQDFDA